METRCRRCSKIFDNQGVLGSNICEECKIIEEQRFQQVRQIVKEKPGISLNEVSILTGVTPRKIMAYVKEERLEYTGESQAVLYCEECGEQIKTGRYCSRCKQKYEPTVRNQPILQAKPTTSSTATQMFTAGKRNK